MNEERDIVEFQDDEGNVIAMEVLDYFFYEGDEYALLTDYQEGAEESCEDCQGDCAACGAERDAYIMKVVPVGDEEEEFVPVDDELADTLIELVQNGFGEDDAFDEDDED